MPLHLRLSQISQLYAEEEEGTDGRESYFRCARVLTLCDVSATAAAAKLNSFPAYDHQAE